MPAALGEMFAMGIDPRRLDEMTWADLASWRSVLVSYHEAIEHAAKRGK